jgi:small subunit ribosomal protein S1
METLMAADKLNETNNTPDPLDQTEELSMEQLLAQEEAAAQAQESTEGPFLSAKVVSIIKDGALVDIGLKGEALIDRSEFGDKPPFHVGETISVLRLRGADPVRVSWKAARDQMSWDEIVICFERKMPIHATIQRDIKGGFVAECENGLRAFVPASQLELKPGADAKKWKNQKITAYILECDRRKGNLVLSRRQWLEEANQKRRAEVLSNLQVGDVREGTVSGIASFGAFIDLGGVEGLLHIGEIEWMKLPKMSQVFKVGQKLQVKVTGFDGETGRISLSRKQLLPHPWDGIEGRFKVGSIVKGKVVNITDFGAFVELEPKVEGLVHVSEISWSKENKKPRELLKAGQEVNVWILAINRAEEKISLSIKRAQENPWAALKAKYPNGSTVKGTVVSFAPFGAFVRLESGLEGLLHVSDISWKKTDKKPEELLKQGQELELKLLNIDVKTGKISLGLKQNEANPYNAYKKGAVLKVKIKELNSGGAVVDLGEDMEGFIPRSEIANEKFEKIEDVVAAGQEVEAKVILVEPKDRKVQLSIRKLDQELQRKAHAKYTGHRPGPLLKDLFE